MNQQLAIDFSAVRACGEAAADACATKAERVAGFDRDGAGQHILGHLRRHGPTPGEECTESAIAHGYTVHDRRAYGAVYQALAKRKLIRCVGFCLRKHGNGTAGGRIWEAVQ